MDRVRSVLNTVTPFVLRHTAQAAVMTAGTIMAIPFAARLFLDHLRSPSRTWLVRARAPPRLPRGFSRRMIDLSTGVRVHAVEAGDPAAEETVLFLHGFPECSHSWRHQMEALGNPKDDKQPAMRCVAIDMRGYSLSDKPGHWSDYTLSKLVADVAAVIDELGGKPVHLVGHDWGGGVAWHTAMKKPDLLLSLTIMNSPHPTCFVKKAGLRQLCRSWYMILFQIPIIPELILRVFDYDGVVEALKTDITDYANKITADDIDAFKFAASRPGALTAMVNYYRANVLPGKIMATATKPKGANKIAVPTCVIHGTADKYLGKELVEGTQKYVKDIRIVFIDGASHWVQQDAPSTVNNELISFFSELRDRPVDVSISSIED